ncbi:MAG: NAD(P)H-quinone oxidoreductase [Rhodospirillales bacterium]|nr:MAG: NAD(P)H-quinone oxidoreductase [Rhodospirillales bacterium]
MTAIEIETPGGPEALRPTIRPVPDPGPGEVLIQVAAAGVNGPDLFQRRGLYPAPPGASDIPGLEVAGTVVRVAPDVTTWKAGDSVCALVTGGGYAEYCTAPHVQCLAVPTGLDLVQAAALPETFFTVWTNVFERGGLKEGEAFLVHGGGGGIGTTAIQMANRLGARVFATAGGEAKCQACERLGAERAIDYSREDFVAIIKEATGGRGVDVILDIVGGDYVARNIACLARDGRLVNIAFRQGSKVELDLMPIMLRRLTLTGSTLRVQSVARKGEIAAALAARVWPLIAAGAILPVIHAAVPLAEAAEAHRIMESGRHIGKIVLTVASG